MSTEPNTIHRSRDYTNPSHTTQPTATQTLLDSTLSSHSFEQDIPPATANTNTHPSRSPVFPSIPSPPSPPSDTIDLNISDFSLEPVRLMSTFETTAAYTAKPPATQPSPNDVKSFPTAPTSFHLPPFHLPPSLSLSLPQPTINRISLYATVYSVNHQLQALSPPSAQEESPSAPSPLVSAVLGPPQDPVVPVAGGQGVVLDEEEFLLAVIGLGVGEGGEVGGEEAFAEAMGEGEERGDGQTANPLSVLGGSRTQLWKPSRSWWEAKSGKNPWIEPRSHNKRWRYLWPLIHYHKFLAKCIKKLKRNSIDVKTCPSSISTFLRSEVITVSSHLASSSRFTSEQWMLGLPEFSGWTPSTPSQTLTLRTLISNLPMKIHEPVDWAMTEKLRDRIDACFSRAMEEEKKGMEEVGEEVRRKVGSGAKARKLKNPKGVKKEYGVSERHNNIPMGWNRGPQMMPPNPHMQQQQHGMYPPQYNHYPNQPPPPPHNTYPNGGGYSFGSGHGAPPGLYGVTEDYPHHQAEWPVHPNMYANVHYNNRWDQQSMNNELQYFPQPNTMGWPTHDDSRPPYPDQSTYNPGSLDTITSATHRLSIEESTHTDASRRDFLITPSKTPKDEKNVSIPPESPYWGHLAFCTLASSGLATPQGGGGRAASPLIRVEGGEGREDVGVQASKPLLLNPSYSYHHQGNAMNVPPSPATQFLMSPQTNSRNNAFFGQGFSLPFPPASPHHHLSSQHHRSQLAVQQTRTVEAQEKGTLSPQRGEDAAGGMCREVKEEEEEEEEGGEEEDGEGVKEE